MAEVVFVIDGKDYESPDMSTLTMAERRVMYDLSGIIQEDFVREPGETDDEHEARVAKMARHPGFLEALMHIAYQRGNPTMKRERVQAVIERTNFQEAIEKWADAEEDDDVPLAQTSEPAISSPTSSPEQNSTSGPDSTNGSAAPDGTPANTGTTRSDTSATSDRSLQAV